MKLDWQRRLNRVGQRDGMKIKGLFHHRGQRKRVFQKEGKGV